MLEVKVERCAESMSVRSFVGFASDWLANQSDGEVDGSART